MFPHHVHTKHWSQSSKYGLSLVTPCLPALSVTDESLSTLQLCLLALITLLVYPVSCVSSWIIYSLLMYPVSLVSSWIKPPVGHWLLMEASSQLLVNVFPPRFLLSLYFSSGIPVAASHHLFSESPSNLLSPSLPSITLYLSPNSVGTHTCGF